MQRQPHLRDPLVAGREPVAITASLLALVALGQLFGVEASAVLDRAGGRPLDVTWSLCLILGWSLVSCAYTVGTNDSSMVLEASGLLLLCVGVGVYAVVLLCTLGSLHGSMMVLALCGAVVATGLRRAWHLRQRLRWVREVVE